MDWSAVGSAVITVPAVAALAWKPFIQPVLQRWVDARVSQRLADHQHELDKQLEGHKTQLLISAESIRTEHQRRLQEFALYITKQHDVYAELYQKL